MLRMIMVLHTVLSIALVGCANLPPDLRAKKDSINANYYSLIEKEKTASSKSDYEQLVAGYKEYKNEAIAYTAECNRRGFSRNNDETIREAEQKISHYTILINSNQTINNESSSIADKYTCDVCSKEFTGNGYCEGDDGNWRPCVSADNTLPYICSYPCAMTKKRSIEDAWNKVDKKIRDLNGNSDGYNNRLPEGAHKCSLCSGTWIERNTAQRILGGESGRICPMCDGKGWVIDGY